MENYCRSDVSILRPACLSSCSKQPIHYIDFTSLYGYVNKYAKYPFGHPLIITNVAKDSKISDFFGIAKVCVRATCGLFHPVFGDKLMFPLCKKCAKSCRHSNAQREFTGTWCTPQLIEAEAGALYYC